MRIAGRRFVQPAGLAATQALVHAGAVVPGETTRGVLARDCALREAVGPSQLHLAAASTLTHEAISNLEGGRRTPYARTVVRLAQALGGDPQRCVGRDAGGLTMQTMAEAAAQLDVPLARVHTWLKQGQLAGTKVSGQWRVAAVVVAELDRSGRLRGGSRRLDPRYRS